MQEHVGGEEQVRAASSPGGTRPLAGVRVLELARILAGPWAGQLLADLGADVVKIEKPDGGDDTRSWGPPFIDGTDKSGYFESTNRGKRSLAVAIDTPEGQATVRRLARDADILIENFKQGALARYGLDYAALSALNPRLIYCSLTGFGQSGPYASRPGYDFMIQGLGGAMSLTGEPEGEPMKTAVAYADVFTGLYASNAVLAALHGRERTGLGCHIDAALLDTQVAVLGNQAMHYLVTGTPPERLGNAHSAIVPYQVFACADGHIILACGNDGQFRRLCGVLGAPWADDPAYATNPGRVAGRAQLVPMMEKVLSGWPKHALLEALERASVPAGPINSLPETFADPQVVHRAMVCRLADRDGRVVPAVRSPIVIDGVAQVATGAAPALGEHRDEIAADPRWQGVGETR